MLFSNSVPKPFFETLHPTLQNLFGTSDNVSIKKLKEAAGLEDSKNITQAELITALSARDITASARDIAMIGVIEQLAFVEPDQNTNTVHNYK